MRDTDEASGINRRELIKRSAAVGGTLLWVAPSVTLLTAGIAPGSVLGCGDDSDLDADFYILVIKCGADSYYLVKVFQDPSGNKPFLVRCGGQITGSSEHDDEDEKDAKSKKPKDDKKAKDAKDSILKKSEVETMKSTYRWSTSNGGCPPDVSFCTEDGALVVSLDADNDGTGCEIKLWIMRRGTEWEWKNLLNSQYGPMEYGETSRGTVRFGTPWR